MALFRVTVKKVLFREAEVEADDIEEARDLAQDRSLDWRDSDCGRGLGDDDFEVLDVEQIEEEEEGPTGWQEG